MSSFQRNFIFGIGRRPACNLPTGRFVFGNLGWSFENVKAWLDLYASPRYHPLHSNLCNTRPGARPAFFFCRKTGGEGRHAIRATDPKTRETEELSALQSRENRRERALPPLPIQAAIAHAPAVARHRVARGMDRRQRAPRRRELLRRALQIDPGVRRRAG